MKLKDVTSESWEFIIDYPKKQKQGIHLYYKGIPYPRRLYYDRLNDYNYMLRALERLGLVKKFILSLGYLPNIVIPRTINLRKYEDFLERLVQMCTYHLSEFLIKDDEWSEPVWEIGKLIRIFLEEAGFKRIATGVSKIFMCFFEFDNGYRYPIQDIFGESSRELMQNPRKEIKRLYAILVSRDIMWEGKQWNIYERGSKLITPLTYLLLIPKFKKAFLKAIDRVDLEKIKFDDNDRFHFSFWNGYQFEGKTFEQRFSPYEDLYKTIPFNKRTKPEETANFMTGN